MTRDWYMLVTNNRNAKVRLKKYASFAEAQQAMKQDMRHEEETQTKRNNVRVKISVWPNERGGRITTELGTSRTWQLLTLTED